MQIIQVTPGAPIKDVQRRLQALGLWTSVFEDASGQKALVASSASAGVPTSRLLQVEGVSQVLAKKDGMPLVREQGRVVQVGPHAIGAGQPVFMAGPCSVESEAQIHEAAKMVASQGATFLRGGCFKPRTSPYSFRGVGSVGLKWMRDAARPYGMKVITEAMSIEQVSDVAEFADVFQVGARNMQNFDLLHAIGRANMPVLLKRGLSATIEEWLLAGEHLLDAGAQSVIYCERGVRSFDGQTRFLLDLAAVVLLQEHYGVPVIVDPSHAAGRKDLIPKLGLGALACGADGLIIETHPHPEDAKSDGPQQFNPEELAAASALWGFASRSQPVPDMAS